MDAYPPDRDALGPDHNERRSGREAARPIAVLQVLPRLDLGGVERGAVEIARAVAEAGGRALIACEPGGRLAPRAEAGGAEIVPGPFASKNPAVMAGNARRLARVIRECGIDLVHARSRAPAWSAFAAARATGAGFVTTWHGVYGARGPLKHFYNSVMALGRPVIAISEFTAGLAKERYRLPDHAVELIPRGADLAQFSEEMVGAERAVTVARAWGIVEDPRPVLLLPGRLSRWKGQPGFVEAAARLKALRGASDFLCLIVGDDGGGMGERLVERARALDALDVLRVAPACDDMPAAYKLAAAVVSASTEPEAFGRVAVEAQAMGRPVIATDHGGARETVDPGVTGWLYPPGDVEALAAAMNRALSMDASARAHMGMLGRARIANRFTVAEMQRRTLRVYERVAGRAFSDAR